MIVVPKDEDFGERPDLGQNGARETTSELTEGPARRFVLSAASSGFFGS
jgi:hypothetical protein